MKSSLSISAKILFIGCFLMNFFIMSNPAMGMPDAKTAGEAAVMVSFYDAKPAISSCIFNASGLLTFSSVTGGYIPETDNDDPADPIYQKLETARQYVLKHEDEKALKAYKSILAHRPGHYEALWNTVILHTSIGHRQQRKRDEEAHYDEAYEYGKVLLENHPDKAGAHFAYSAAVGRKAQSVGARERISMSEEIRKHAEKALELDPEYARAWNVLGNWHHRAANLSRLERLAANTLFGGAPEGASNEKARDSFKKAMEIDPNFILYYHDKAAFYITIGEKENARRVLNKGLALPVATSDDSRWKANMRDKLSGL